MQQYEQTWDELQRALDDLNYVRDPLPDPGEGFRPYKRFRLRRDDEANYAVLIVKTFNPNYYVPGEDRLTNHEAVVPVATFNYQNWVRWVFDRLHAIEYHELCETFMLADREACFHCGKHDDSDGDHSCDCPSNNADGDCGHTYPWMTRPYAPHHGHGEDPYVVWHTREDRAAQVALRPGERLE